MVIWWIWRWFGRLLCLFAVGFGVSRISHEVGFLTWVANLGVSKTFGRPEVAEHELMTEMTNYLACMWRLPSPSQAHFLNLIDMSPF